MFLRFLGLLIVALAPLFAQSPTANIVGKVEDQTGAVVPKANVTVRHIATQEVRAVSSDSAGNYVVANLSPGVYDIAVEKDGFRRLEERGINLEVDQTARLEFHLQLGKLAEVVEVTASVPLLNTESAMKGDVITSREIVDLPLDGRDFEDLAYLVPGVGEKAQGGSGSNFAVNGARSDNTNFVVDGFTDQNVRDGSPQFKPPLDSMMEFKMQTTGYSAEYGRLAGGTMNMVLKSGTNRPHVALFEFLRNDAMDARGVFDPQKTNLRRNQFGAAVDGPVYIPKIYDGRNRTFFLFNWESYRQVVGSSGISTAPSLLERQGDFSRSLDVNGKPAKLVDPLSGGAAGACVAGKIGLCFPGNVIPASRIDPIARQVTAYYPAPNRAGVVNNFYSVVSDPDSWNSFLAKIDQRLSGSDTLSIRFMKKFSMSASPYNGSPFGGFGASTTGRPMLAGISHTRLIGAAIINEARLGVSRTATRNQSDRTGRDYAKEWGLQGSTSDPDIMGFPLFTVTDIGNLGNAANMPVFIHVTNYQWADTLTWVKGKHMLKFGADVVRTQFFQPYYNNARGTYAFNGYWTTVPFADFETGVLNAFTRTSGTAPNYLFFTNSGFFAQDDVRVSRSLTLNFGVRYELPSPPNEKFGRLANFVPELGIVLLASDKTVSNLNQVLADASLVGKVKTAEAAGFPESLIYPYYKRFAPRFGFAWRPKGGVRTVVRGGYGVFYGNNLWNAVRNDLGNTYPFAIAQSLSKNNNRPDLLTLSNPLGVKASLSGVLTPNGFQAYQTPQYLQSWNLTIEREIVKATAIEIAYVGSKGTHLGRKYNLNTPFRIPSLRPTPNGAFPRPYPAFSDIDYYSFGSNSIYNAGMATLRKRFSRGLLFRLNYVYSKSIDDASQIENSSAGGYGGAQDARNLRLERGRSDFDRGHSVTSLFTWDLPSFGARGAAGRLLKNWQIAATMRFQTGPPFTLKTSNVQLDQGQANRPDRIAKGSLENPSPEMWYDKAAFPQVPSGAFLFGTSGRNVLDGPGLVDGNLSLIKRFRIQERYTWQFRCEAFNFLNHPNFNLPNPNVNAAAGGTITGVRSARLFQVGLRLQY